MGYSCKFLHNAVYTADDVNDALSRLTTQGVSLFKDTGDTLMDLNTAVSNMVTNGVDLFNTDACKVVNVGGNVYKVMPGTAFMPNGEMMVVDDEGYTFSVELGQNQNVVMHVTANTGFVGATSEECPLNGILLATIAPDGVIADKRTYATTKVAPATANVAVAIEGTYRFDFSDDNYYDINVGWGGYNYVLASRGNYISYMAISENGTGGCGLNDIGLQITKDGLIAHLRTYKHNQGATNALVQLIFV